MSILNFFFLIDRRGENSLHYAVRSGHPEFVTLLLEHGVNPRQTSTEGKTPLEEAEQFNIRKCLTVLEGNFFYDTFNIY